MKTTKKQMVLTYLENHIGLTNTMAVVNLGVGDLAGIVRNLRDDGYNILSVKQEGKDRYGKLCHFVEYRLVKETLE